jgi:hypothetical protein
MIGHTKHFIVSLFNSIFNEIYIFNHSNESMRCLKHFELENSFSSKSQNVKEKNLFRKNRGKVGERAHVDTENRTMKSAQHDFWYYLYILLVTTTGCIIVNNSIFFELTSVGMYVYVYVCVKRTNKTNAYLVHQPLFGI